MYVPRFQRRRRDGSGNGARRALRLGARGGGRRLFRPNSSRRNSPGVFWKYARGGWCTKAVAPSLGGCGARSRYRLRPIGRDAHGGPIGGDTAGITLRTIWPNSCWRVALGPHCSPVTSAYLRCAAAKGSRCSMAARGHKSSRPCTDVSCRPRIVLPMFFLNHKLQSPGCPQPTKPLGRHNSSLGQKTATVSACRTRRWEYIIVHVDFQSNDARQSPARHPCAVTPGGQKLPEHVHPT